MLPILDSVLGIGEKVIDRLWPDPQEKAKAKLELARLAQQGEFRDLELRLQAIVAEAKSEHTLTATWRPLTMLAFVLIIANNYILAPYLSLLFGVSVTLDIPPDMWDLLKLGIGGYVASRGVEKAIEKWKT